MRSRILLGAVALILFGSSAVHAGSAERPTRLAPENDASHALAWEGTVTGPRGAHSFFFVADLGAKRRARVTSWVEWESPEDLALTILDANGEEVESSDDLPGETEIASYDVLNGERYEVRVSGFANGVTDFRGWTWVRSAGGRDFPEGTDRLRYPAKRLLARIDVPINIVFVGFDADEVAEHRRTLLEQLPPRFRPAIRIGSSLGGTGLVRREGGDGPRRLLALEGSEMEIEPIEYRYRYNIVTTPDSYTRALFAAAKRASELGDYQLPFDRDFIERYNTRGSPLRGPDHTVPPGREIQFVDGFSLEEWVAKNPPAGLDFDLDDPARGYTYFVIDSFRPDYAAEYFDPDRYHNFRVMNDLTTDPDSGAQNGFDWGRVWGGRWRFLMLDVGAAPNGWEAAHYPTTKIFRVEANGDSSLHDPPIWHYPPEDLSSFYERVGEDVQYAIWMRFTRGYLYRPTPYDTYILAANTWHDASAYRPWPSRLESLYKDELVLRRYRELIPYAEFDGFSRYKYLSPGDPEQDAIDEGKRRAIAGAPAPFTVNTRPTMRLVDRNRERYAPIEPGAFTIPVINVVFQSLYTWSLPAVVGGIAEGQGGDAWGQLQNVNDRTKWPGATGEVEDSSGASHAPTVPDERVEGVDNVARFGFTATALHEAGHFLGLSHNHDAVAYDWKLSEDAEDPANANGYYEAIDWMYTTTASPMSYGWEYNRFEVMDKDNVWIGHAVEWLKRAQNGLVDAYDALDSRGRRSVPPTVLDAKIRTEGLMGEAIGALRDGRYLLAVRSARAAVTASEQTVRRAAATVLGGRERRGRVGGALPATGTRALDASALFATAVALAALLLRRRAAG